MKSKRLHVYIYIYNMMFWMYLSIPPYTLDLHRLIINIYWVHYCRKLVVLRLTATPIDVRLSENVIYILTSTRDWFYILQMGFPVFLNYKAFKELWEVWKYKEYEKYYDTRPDG